MPYYPCIVLSFEESSEEFVIVESNERFWDNAAAKRVAGMKTKFQVCKNLYKYHAMRKQSLGRGQQTEKQDSVRTESTVDSKIPSWIVVSFINAATLHFQYAMILVRVCNLSTVWWCTSTGRRCRWWISGKPVQMWWQACTGGLVFSLFDTLFIPVLIL